MKTNTKKVKHNKVYTGGGAVASTISNELALRRAVLTNFLWEDVAYDTGESVTDTISALIPKVQPSIVSEIAREARTKQYLRHVPLFIVREMVKHEDYKPYVSDTLSSVINRADELAEFLSIYWKGGKTPIASSVRKGLSKALCKFDEYQLSKYSGNGRDIKLKDVIKLIHPKPYSKSQSKLWKKVIDGSLKTADTWESELSENGNNKESWTRLLNENKVGGLALLRNLRNIQNAGVEDSVIEKALSTNSFKYVLPFRFITAMKYAPRFQKELEKAMLRQLSDQEKIKGKTVVVVDVSGSMGATMSGYSENTRLDIASSIAVILRELCEDVVIYCTAGCDGHRTHDTQKIDAPRRGFELCNQIANKVHILGGGGIFLRQCTEFINSQESNVDRLVVISDSQDCDYEDRRGPDKSTTVGKKHNYIIDISCEKHGIGYNKFTVINGFSEKVIDFIKLYEDLLLRSESSQPTSKPKRKYTRKKLN